MRLSHWLGVSKKLAFVPMSWTLLRIPRILFGVSASGKLFFTHFFSPLLGPAYLARAGTATELFDLARLTVEHRADEFFYPLIPLVPSVEDLRQLVFADRGDLASELDPQDFDWLRTHIFLIFLLSIRRGISWLACFFGSLAKNACGEFDTSFLN